MSRRRKCVYCGAQFRYGEMDIERILLRVDGKDRGETKYVWCPKCRGRVVIGERGKG